MIKKIVLFLLNVIKWTILITLYLIAQLFRFLYNFLLKNKIAYIRQRRKDYDEKILAELGYYRDGSQILHKVVNNVITTIPKEDEKRIIRQIHGKSKYTRKEQVQIIRKLRKEGILKTPFFERPNVKLWSNILFGIFGFPVLLAVCFGIAESCFSYADFKNHPYIYYGPWAEPKEEFVYIDTTLLKKAHSLKDLKNIFPEIIETSDFIQGVEHAVIDGFYKIGETLFAMPFFLAIIWPVSIVLGLIVCRILYGFDPDLEDDEKSVNTKALDIIIAKSIYDSCKELDRRKNSKPKFDD